MFDRYVARRFSLLRRHVLLHHIVHALINSMMPSIAYRFTMFILTSAHPSIANVLIEQQALKYSMCFVACRTLALLGNHEGCMHVLYS